MTRAITTPPSASVSYGVPMACVAAWTPYRSTSHEAQKKSLGDPTLRSHRRERLKNRLEWCWNGAQSKVGSVPTTVQNVEFGPNLRPLASGSEIHTGISSYEILVGNSRKTAPRHGVDP